MHKDLIFVRRNVDWSHTDDGILEVLQLERHTILANCRIDIRCMLLPSSKKLLFVIIFESLPTI